MMADREIKASRTRPILLPHPGLSRRGEFSPDGRYVLTTCEAGVSGGQARLWIAETGEPASDWIVHGEDPESVSIGFSPSGDRFLTGGQDGNVRLHGTNHGDQIAEFAMKTKISDAIWSADGQSVIVAGQNKSLRMLCAATGEERVPKLKLPRAPGSDGHTRSMQISPDGCWLAVAAGLKVTLIDLRQGTIGPTLRHRLRVTSIAWRDNERLITASDDYVIREWNATTGTLSREVYHTPRWIWTLQRSDDGQRLLIGTEDEMAGAGHSGHAEVIDIDSGNPVTQWLRHDGATLAIFSPDEAMIATGSSDRTAALWDVARNERLRHHNYGYMIYGVRFSPAGDRLLVVGGPKAAILEVL